jgi:hypothetical protein
VEQRVEGSRVRDALDRQGPYVFGGEQAEFDAANSGGDGLGGIHGGRLTSAVTRPLSEIASAQKWRTTMASNVEV